MTVKAWHLLELCLSQLREHLADSRPRAFLFQTLDSLRVLSTRWPAEQLAATDPVAGLFGTVLVDALATCAICLALLRDLVDETEPGAAVYSLAATLRAEAVRLEVLLGLVRMVDRCSGSWAKAAEDWDPAALFVRGAASSFWRKHFGAKQASGSTLPVVVPSEDFLAAIASTYTLLNDEEGRGLLAWLRPDVRERITLAEAVLVLDAPGAGGMWRAVLSCISWPELCAEALVPAVVAGGRDRHLAITVKDLVAEKRSQGRSVVLPGWSRAMLLSDRAAFRVLRALGMEAAADVAGHGLLLRLPSEALARALQKPLPTLTKAFQELLGRGVVGGFPAKATGRFSIERCIAEQAALMYSIQDGRQQHSTLSQILRRKVLELQDSMLDLQGLWHHEQVLAKAEAPSITPFKTGASALEAGCRGLQALHQELWAALREAEEWEHAHIAAVLRHNAELRPDVPVQTQLLQLQEHAAVDAQESARMAEVNAILARQIQTHAEVSKMEGELAVLESSFARARRELVLRYQEILQQIATEEEELLAVSGTLAQKREAAYAAADAVTDLRLILAERMVPLPAGPIGANDALEEQLNQDVQSLQKKAENLEQTLKKLRGASKKRHSDLCNQ